MSVEDDLDSVETELKDLVVQTLEENGLLAKIRAQLRAGLYVALETEVNESNKQSHIDASLRNNLSKADIRTVFCLVREFLEYFQLDFTNSVFEKESFMGILYDYKGKERLIKELEIGVENAQTPLLLEILNIARNTYKHSTKMHETTQNISYFINDSKEFNNATYEIPSSKIDFSTPLKNTTTECSDEKNVSKNSLNDSNETSVSSVDSKNSSEHIVEDKPIDVHNSQEVSKNETEPQKIETDDTYEGTSSIAEDSIISNNKESPLIDLDKTGKILTPNLNSPIATVKCLIDQTLDESPPNKSPRLHEGGSEKKKDKTEKPKPMSGLSSLSDLPPLQVTKTRSPDTVLLPSLYSKEFREKSNLKEIDKLLDLNFDSIDNYEEDFILTAGIDFERNKNINSVLSKNDHNKLPDSSKHFTPVKLFENENRAPSNKNLDYKKSDKSTSSKTDNGNGNANSNSNLTDKKDDEATSISEELDFNSNSDDILKSN